MTLIRKPDFAEISSDQDITKFKLVVGNESNSIKTMITLKEYLESIDKHTGNSKLKSMYLPRDEKILTSSQACILPLSDGEVEFNVKLYNYQFYNTLAVLVLVCSLEDTSAQIVNGRDCTLYFNKANENANYIAEQLTDDRIRREVPLEGPMSNEEKQRNSLLIFQIPLVYEKVPNYDLCKSYQQGSSGYDFYESSGNLEFQEKSVYATYSTKNLKKSKNTWF